MNSTDLAVGNLFLNAVLCLRNAHKTVIISVSEYPDKYKP